MESLHEKGRTFSQHWIARNLCCHPQIHRDSNLKSNNDIGASLSVDTAARVGGHNPVPLNSKPWSRLSPHWLWWLEADTFVFAPALRLAIAHFYPSVVCLPWTRVEWAVAHLIFKWSRGIKVKGEAGWPAEVGWRGVGGHKGHED